MSALGSGRCIKPMKLAQKDELIDDLHLLIEPALFREIAHTMEVFAFERLTEEAHFDRVRNGDADHHADRRGFAGAIRTKQSEHAAGLDAEGEFFYGDSSVVGFADLLEFYNG